MNAKLRTNIFMVSLLFCCGCYRSSEIEWEDIEWGLGYDIVVDKAFFVENKLAQNRVKRHENRYMLCDDCGFFGLAKNVKIKFCANNQNEIFWISKSYRHKPVTEAEFYDAADKLAENLGIVWSRRGSSVFYGIKRWSTGWIGEMDDGWRYVSIGSYDTGLAEVFFRRECSV